MELNNLGSCSKSMTFVSITLLFDKTTLGSKCAWKSLNVSKGDDSWVKGFKGICKKPKIEQDLIPKVLVEALIKP
jgi:hypothetical protein